MNKRKSILIIYDIEDNKKRNKVVRLLESHGIRVQKSAFELYINDSELIRMKKKLIEFVSPNDSIRFYSGCDYCFDIGKNASVDMYRNDILIL